MALRKTAKKSKIKQFQKGRVCKKQGCKRTLSIYNPLEYCYVHHNEEN